MRYKIYTKEQIVKAGYNIVAREGFDKFTARNVAQELGISTQPIYLQFKNMKDLKTQVLDKVWNDIERINLTKPITGDIIVDSPVHFIELALKKPTLYKACWVDNNGGGEYLFAKSEAYYREQVFKDDRFKHLSDEEFRNYHLETLIAVSGIISLQNAGIIHLTHEDFVNMCKKMIDDIAKGQKLDLIQK